MTSSVPSPTVVAAGPNDPNAIVVAVVQTCRLKDSDGLRALVPGSVTDAEITAMLAEGNDVQLLSQSMPDITADAVSIDVALRVLTDDGESTVRRTWELERVDDMWRLTELPRCF